MSHTESSPPTEPDGDFPQIVQTEDTLGGQPRIEGRRIGVLTLYNRYEGRDETVEEISDAYSLSEAEVHAALAYALANSEQMAAIEERRQRAYENSETRVTPETKI